MSETSARVEADILYKLEKEVICLSLLSVMLSSVLGLFVV